MFMRLALRLTTAVALTTAFVGLAQADALRDKWCKDVHIRFFVGGAEGDAFGTIVYNGAKQAEQDLGATVDYVFSGWKVETMVQQLREAVAVEARRHRHDGPSWRRRNHAARRRGVESRHQDDVSERAAAGRRREVRRRLCRCPAGAQGRALGEEAVRRFGLKKGDKAIVLGPFDQHENRYVREGSTADALTNAGLEVTKLVAPAGSRRRSQPPHSDDHRGPPANAPDTKVIAYPGGQSSATCLPS